MIIHSPKKKCKKEALKINTNGKTSIFFPDTRDCHLLGMMCKLLQTTTLDHTGGPNRHIKSNIILSPW